MSYFIATIPHKELQETHLFRDLRYKTFTAFSIMGSIDLTHVQESLTHYGQDCVLLHDLSPFGNFDTLIDIRFLPGVTDNLAHTLQELLQTKTPLHAHTLYAIFGKGSIADFLQTIYNPLIQEARIYQSPQQKLTPPKPVLLTTSPQISEIDIHNPQGIAYLQSLGLAPNFIEAIQTYFLHQKRLPRDGEVEMIAQTWSEHCKHTIFQRPMDEATNGIFKDYIARATEEIRAIRGQDDICISVFEDNAGGIIFDEDWLICDKVETHNTPSALDPFGGALTGILGVNRDCLGFGMGAKPIANRYGFCLAPATDSRIFYRKSGKQEPILSAEFIIDGVIQGIEEGGNHSGIPTPQGFIYYHPRYRAKPLVFAGTIGLMPRTLHQKPAHLKCARAGDKIIVIGGRVGKDGIHGATFSSETLHENSPVSAVQIGDPITQKKLTDILLHHLQRENLYTSLTDNGAGGLSSSIGEMALQSGGCEVHLEHVALKYPGLQPWEIWVSESQERMSLAVPEQHVERVLALLGHYQVEGQVIGTFTCTGDVRVYYHGNALIHLDLHFLHKGWPKAPLTTKAVPTPKTSFNLPAFTREQYLRFTTHCNLNNPAWLATRYDHEVQSTSILKPLQGVGRIKGDVTGQKPFHHSDRTVLLSQALYPLYTEIDPYLMAAHSIDSCIAQLICAGASLDYIALLDNFCWCSALEATRLWQLKEAAKACYDIARLFLTPFISGKDSMFNDFSGFDERDQRVKLSSLPTLLISGIAVNKNYRNIISIDAKEVGDLIYLIGTTPHFWGGSEFCEYFQLPERFSPLAPFEKEQAVSRYQTFARLNEEGIIMSAIHPHLGGIAHALNRMLLSGGLGADIQLEEAITLFIQSPSRILCTIKPSDQTYFEQQMPEANCIGIITQEPRLRLLQQDMSFELSELRQCL